MKPLRFMTSNGNAYEKLSLLHITDSVFLEGVDDIFISRLLKSFNKDKQLLIAERKGTNDFLIRKVAPLDFRIYLNRD